MSLNKYVILTITMMLGLCSTAQADLYNIRKDFVSSFLSLETNSNGMLINDSIYLSYQSKAGPGYLFALVNINSAEVVDTFYQTTSNYFLTGQENSLIPINDSVLFNTTTKHNGTVQYKAITKLNLNTFDTIETLHYNPEELNYSDSWYSGFRLDDSLHIIGLTNEGTSSTASRKLIFCKLDTLGNFGSKKVYPNDFNVLPYDFIKTSDNNFLVVGKCNPISPLSGADEADNFVFKLNPYGNIIWSIYHREDMNNGVPQIIEVDDGYIYTSNKRIDYDYFVSEEEAAYINGLEPGTNVSNFLLEDLYAYKIDFDGNPISERRLSVGNPVSDIDSWAMIKTSDGNIAISIEVTNHYVGDGYGKGAIYKITPDLDSLWFRRYQVLDGINSENRMRDIEQLPDGSFFCNGYCNPGDASDPCCQDAWLMRTNCLGFLEWPVAAFESYNGNNYNIHLVNNSTSFGTCTVNWGDGSTYSLVHEGMDSIISHQYPDNQTYTVTLTASACGVDSTISFEVTPSVVAIPEIANDLTFAIYPNPTSNWVTVTFQALKNKGSLSVINLDGKIMLQKKLEQGQEEIELNTSDLQSGTYFIQVQIGATIETKKLNVIK